MRSTSLSQSFKETQKQLLETRRRVEDFDEAVGDDGVDELQLQKEINDLGVTLGALLKAVSSGDDLWTRKIQNAQNEQKMMNSTLREACKRRNIAREEEEEKRALQDRRYDLDSVKLDNEYKINAAATDSVDMVSRYIEMGRSTVAEFRRQRVLLETVQSRMIDAGHTMGLSQSMMNVIQRRDFVDRLITFGGMLVVLLIVALIWYWKR